jgi:hypothetical protein
MTSLVLGTSPTLPLPVGLNNGDTRSTQRLGGSSSGTFPIQTPVRTQNGHIRHETCDASRRIGPRQACGDAVSRVYPHRFEFSGCKIVQVMFDVADEPYADVETRLAALMARD